MLVAAAFVDVDIKVKEKCLKIIQHNLKLSAGQLEVIGCFSSHHKHTSELVVNWIKQADIKVTKVCHVLKIHIHAKEPTGILPETR